MDLSVHLIVSTIIAAFLYPYYGWISAFVIIGGFLIDADHYAWTVMRKRKIGILYSYNYYKKSQHLDDYILHVFHTIESMILISVLAALYTPALMFAIGYFGHMIMDRVDAARWHREQKRRFRMFWFNDQKGQRTFSIIYWLLIEYKLLKIWRPKYTRKQQNQHNLHNKHHRLSARDIY
jgi:hypothetical protein